MKYSGETFNHRFKLNWNQNNFDIHGINFSCYIQTMIERCKYGCKYGCYRQLHFGAVGVKRVQRKIVALFSAHLRPLSLSKTYACVDMNK